MTRIITSPYTGTRYRADPNCNHTSWQEMSLPCYEAGELPRIPGWPLPGPAPQYLSDSLKVPLKEGDWVCTVEPGRVDFSMIWGVGIVTLDDYQYNESDRAYLITRADPQEDA